METWEVSRRERPGRPQRRPGALRGRGSLEQPPRLRPRAADQVSQGGPPETPTTKPWAMRATQKAR
eukprot:1079166-Karenia_brevis.AAC.1